MDFRDTVKESRLSNGLRIITDTIPDNPVMYGALHILTGGLHDPEDKKGLAHLSEHMMGYGRPSETREDYVRNAKAIGFKNFNMTTRQESASYWAYGECADVEKYLTEMSERLTKRAYYQEALEVERSRITNEMLKAYQDEDEKKRILSLRARFGRGMLAQPSAGTTRGFANISLQDIADYHEETIVGSNMVLMTSGGWTHKQAVQWADDNLAHLPIGKKSKLAQSPYSVQDVWFEKAGETEIEVELFFPTGDDHMQSSASITILTSILNTALSPVADKYGLYFISTYQSSYPSKELALQLKTSCAPEKLTEILRDTLEVLDDCDQIIEDNLDITKSAVMKSDRLYSGVELMIPEVRIGKMEYSFFQSGSDVHAQDKVSRAIKDVSKNDVLRVLKRALSQRPGTFYYGKITDNLPTGEMIQRRDFSGQDKRPEVIHKFSPTP
jgi:predicted Zn-dependent peptidase